jgi:uncharacterized membrane protein YhaH (DUF805 family)
MEWYLMVWKRYAEFSGRSRRKELWMFVLFNMIVALALYVPALVAATQGSSLSTIFFVLYFIYVLAALVPGWAVGARRLHDIGKSGWWWLIALVPFVGAIILIVFWVMEGQPGDNEYGPNPKLPAPAGTIG